jgi:predicted aldo/keto reductase-like oxidoreductase
LETRPFGNTGSFATRLCHGTGLMNPRRFALSAKEGADLIRYGIDSGINFIDTALGYQTHAHVSLAIKGLPRSSVIINTKINARDAATARTQIETCLSELGVDYIDSLLMHGIRSAEDFRAREPVLEEIRKAKARGHVRLVGASTHVFGDSAVRSCLDDPRIEIILALINATGHGLLSGTYPEHVQMLEQAHARGKFIMSMKVLGEGYHADDAEPHLRSGFALDWVDSMDLGMNNRAQIDMAIRIANGEDVPAELAAAALVNAKQEWGINFPAIYAPKA